MSIVFSYLFVVGRWSFTKSPTSRRSHCPVSSARTLPDTTTAEPATTMVVVSGIGNPKREGIARPHCRTSSGSYTNLDWDNMRHGFAHMVAIAGSSDQYDRMNNVSDVVTNTSGANEGYSATCAQSCNSDANCMAMMTCPSTRGGCNGSSDGHDLTQTCVKIVCPPSGSFAAGWPLGEGHGEPARLQLHFE